MVTKQLYREDGSSSANSTTMPNRTFATSMSSSSSSRFVTPLSSSFAFGEQSALNQTFEAQSPSHRTTRSSSIASNDPLPHSSKTFTFSQGPASTQSFAFNCHYDRDTPLPSVETDSPPLSSSRSTPSIILNSPSTSTHAQLTQGVSNQDPVLQQIDGFSNLRLTSPRATASPSPQQFTPPPPINANLSVQPNASNQARAGRADSLINGITHLRIDAPGTSTSRDSRSPSQSHRRRSGSEGFQQRHQVENEDPPEAFRQLPQVQSALAQAKNLTQRMVNVLSSSNLHQEKGSSVESLYHQAQKLDDFKLPSSRIVGLVGDSGTGKSSLINCLLDRGELARVSGKGIGCTCAVTEYIFHDRDDFIIHVDYFPLNELQRQFEELLRAYRDVELLSETLRGRDEHAEHDMANSERTNLERKANLARETFRASFPSKLEDMPTVLSSMPFEQAVEVMVGWASQSLPRHEEQETFSTIEGCASRLRELSSEFNNPSTNTASGTCWPFILKLRVYMKAYILSKGLILTDLPGLRDLNSARKAVTERYIQQCDQIFVVADISRAITNESIKEIFELSKRIKMAKIDVVCTRAEEIRATEAKNDWPAERERIEEMQRDIDVQTQNIEDLDEASSSFMDEFNNVELGQHQEYFQVQKDLREARNLKANHEFMLKRHMIQLRNDKISEGLRKQYRGQTLATTSKIFCVSNIMYSKNREKPVTVALPYLNLSGIPELRRHCIGIVAQSRLRAAKKFIHNEIPAFLGSVELWVEAGSGNASAERKQQILNAVSAIQEVLEEWMFPASFRPTISSTLNEEFKNQIYHRMKQGSRQWTDHARQASIQWHAWHSMTYKSFCGNYGEHSTAQKRNVCWNEEAMQSMKNTMLTVWDCLLMELEGHLENFHDDFIQVFDEVYRIAASNSSTNAQDASKNAMRTLAAIVKHRKGLAIDDLELATESFFDGLSSLHNDTFSSIQTGYIGKLMRTTYNKAKITYGPGSDLVRKNLITEGYGSESLFREHRRSCKQDFEKIASSLQDKIFDIVEQRLYLIEDDLQTLRDENVVLQSERNPEFRRRVSAEVEDAHQEIDNLKAVVKDVV